VVAAARNCSGGGSLGPRSGPGHSGAAGWLASGRWCITPGLLDQAALLARFHDLHPAVDIRYVRDTSMALISEVAAARLDVALVSLPRLLPEQLMAIPLLTQPVLFVCPPGHPLAGRKRVALTSLADQDFVGPLPGWTALEDVDRGRVAGHSACSARRILAWARPPIRRPFSSAYATYCWPPLPPGLSVCASTVSPKIVPCIYPVRPVPNWQQYRADGHCPS
jgi:LysR substrate binding domain-containing protein